MIIVDFDHTLFQTKNFVDAIIKVFSNYGVSEEDFRQAYKKSIKDWEDVCGFGYTFEKNIDELKKMGHDLDVEKLLQELKELIKKEYLFFDAIDFLEHFKKEKMVLMTAGDKDFQRLKVETVEIEKYFVQTFYLENGKAKYLKDNIKSSERIFFVNDNLVENKAVHELNPEIVIITKINLNKYAVGDAKEAGFPYFETLTEIKEYIENYE